MKEKVISKTWILGQSEHTLQLRYTLRTRPSGFCVDTEKLLSCPAGSAGPTVWVGEGIAFIGSMDECCQFIEQQRDEVIRPPKKLWDIFS